jgi:alpha-beta hydrolase superfamily lysophospholipase
MNIGNETVVWGHSQGGGAALWVGIESLTYAPDVPLLGVAAMAPASDLTLLADGMMASAGGPLFASFILYGYSEVYDDVKLGDYVRPAAQTVVEEIQGRCLAEPSVLVSIASLASGEEIFSGDLKAGALGQRFAENVPGAVTGIPTFLGQGAADDLVVPEGQSQFVANWCADGQVVEYYTYAGRDHLSVVAEDSPMIGDLLAWTTARFAGEANASACSTTES